MSQKTHAPSIFYQVFTKAGFQTYKFYKLTNAERHTRWLEKKVKVYSTLPGLSMYAIAWERRKWKRVKLSVLGGDIVYLQAVI